jgi:uncharacterized protein YlaI
VKFVRPNVPAGNAPGGHVGAPQSRDWLKEWIENKGRWVRLICGHIEDLNDRTLTILKTFPGTEVLCNECNRFVLVKESLRTKRPPTKIPDEPLY